MQRFRLLVAAAAVVGFLGAGATQGSAPGKKGDKEKLQGTWAVTGLEIGGQPIPGEYIKGMKFTFTGNKLSMVDPKGKVIESTFTIDDAKKPKTIDIAAPKGKEKAMVGIYTLDGDDTLKICGVEEGDTRPKDFATQAGSKAMLLTFKREK
jgi:uncharacterized protein (TIGR03067 family)